MSHTINSQQTTNQLQSLNTNTNIININNNDINNINNENDNENKIQKFHFREKRNYQVAVTSLLYFLLNEHYQIEISRTLVRKSKVSKRLLRLKSISMNNEIIDVETIIKRRCFEKLAYERKIGTEKNRARRRLEIFRITEMIHMMIDILDFYGYYFQSQFSTGVGGVFQNDTVRRIWLKDKLIFNQVDIENVGLKIYDYMLKEVENNKFVFEIGDIVKHAN